MFRIVHFTGTQQFQDKEVLRSEGTTGTFADEGIPMEHGLGEVQAKRLQPEHGAGRGGTPEVCCERLLDAGHGAFWAAPSSGS